jgi:uncharacterized protein
MEIIGENGAKIGNEEGKYARIYYTSNREYMGIVHYDGKYPHGDCYCWYRNGNLWKKCVYRRGKLHGESATYWPCGTLCEIGNWFEDQRDGEFKYYVEQNSSDRNPVDAIIYYKNGVKHGELSEYYDTGEIFRKALYENDKCISDIHYGRDGHTI